MSHRLKSADLIVYLVVVTLQLWYKLLNHFKDQACCTSSPYAICQIQNTPNWFIKTTIHLLVLEIQINFQRLYLLRDARLWLTLVFFFFLVGIRYSMTVSYESKDIVKTMKTALTRWVFWMRMRCDVVEMSELILLILHPSCRSCHFLWGVESWVDLTHGE